MLFLAAIRMTPLLIVLSAVLIFAIIIVVFLYARKLASMLLGQRQDLDKAVAAIDLLLKQRHDELPKLVSTARSYLPADSKALRMISEARAAYTRSSNSRERGRASGAESEALRVLFKETEQYPDLKLNTSFRQVRKRLDDLSIQIDKELDRAREEVRAFNRRLSGFPVSWVAGLSRIRPRAEIEGSEGRRPKA